MQDLNELVNTLKEVPAMPNVIVHALNILKDPDSSMRELADIISYDQSLSTKVLTLVDSAYYGLAQQISSVSRAITICGMTKAKNIIITVAMRPMLINQGDKELWQHSIKVAVGCQYLAQYLKIMDPDDAFVVGFLHDLGKIVLNIKDATQYKRVENLVQMGGNVIETEQMIFGADHTQTGSLLAKKWQLPLLITNTIKYHHVPAQSSMKVPCELVYLVDSLVQDDWSEEKLDTEAIESLNIKLDQPAILRDSILSKANILLNQLST